MYTEPLQKYAIAEFQLDKEFMAIFKMVIKENIDWFWDPVFMCFILGRKLKCRDG